VPAEHLHHTRRPAQPRVGPDEYALDPGADEEVDESLREAPVDRGRGPRSSLATIESRVVDVDVEPVLVRGVARPEWPALPPAQVPDAEAWGVRMLLRVASGDAQDEADKRVGTPAPPGPVRPPMQERIPREERRAPGGEPNAADEMTGRRASERPRLLPPDRARRRREAALPRQRAREATGDEAGHDQAECSHPPGTRTSVAPVLVGHAVGVEILLSALAIATSEPTRSAETFGHSVQGRPLRAQQLGDADNPYKVLVVGCIHGNECAGTAVTRRLVRRAPPADFDLWVVHTVNPDGRRLHVRQNARGVDLNRNFNSEWIPIGTRWDPQYSGPYPWSEPETRAVRRLVFQIHPDITIWFHQPQTLVRAWGQSVTAGRRYARFSGMAFRRLRWPHGTAPNWQNHRFPGTSSFVVELAPGPLSDRRARRDTKAVFRLARSFLAAG
jgi:murein peptide amidase A